MSGSVGSEDGDMGFQIAPMVDVVFVLLLFFMASAGSQVVEKQLFVNLPSKGAPGAQPRVPAVIEISPDGAVTMNGDSFGTGTDRNLLALKEKLKSIVDDFGGEDPVIIRPSPETRQGRVIDVLNACAYAKVVNLTFG